MLKVALMSMAVVGNAAATVHQTPYFKVVNEGKTAQVFPLKDNVPRKLWGKACRKALSYPLRVQKQQQLAQELNLPLSETINYATSELTDYQEEKISGGLSCTGNIEETEPELGKAILALTNAWWSFEQNEKRFLKPLLRISMANTATRNDSIVLIATQTGGEKSEKIFKSQVDSKTLLLNKSKAAMANFWLEQGGYQSAIDITAHCNSQQCYKLHNKAKTQKELQDEKTADDLSSYF
jgi:hypothetical protein